MKYIQNILLVFFLILLPNINTLHLSSQFHLEETLLTGNFSSKCIATMDPRVGRSVQYLSILSDSNDTAVNLTLDSSLYCLPNGRFDFTQQQSGKYCIKSVQYNQYLSIRSTPSDKNETSGHPVFKDTCTEFKLIKTTSGGIQIVTDNNWQLYFEKNLWTPEFNSHGWNWWFQG